MTFKTKRRKMPPYFLGVPAQSWLYREPAVALMNLFACAPQGSAFLLNSRGPSSIAANRNMIVSTLLGAKADGRPFEFLLFVDSDMTPPADTAHRLWESALETDADVVSGLYFDRRPPYFPMVQFPEGH